MAQSAKPQRGRPRAYDREVALTRAMDRFWETGYAATSLDDLSSVMSMNRPSIYAAFGDKEALYRQALDHYRARSRAAMAEVLDEKRPLREALQDFYERAIEVYFSDKGTARGCFMIGTTLTEAVANPQLRRMVAESLQRLDRILAARITLGQQRGEVRDGASPAELAQIASATLYLMSIHARAGATRKSLKATMQAALNTICVTSGT